METKLLTWKHSYGTRLFAHLCFWTYTFLIIQNYPQEFKRELKTNAFFCEITEHEREHERTRTRIFQTSEHERTRTRILCEVLNTNEHEHSFFKKCRTWTNTNTCFFEIIEHREHERTRTLVDFHPCAYVQIKSLCHCVLVKYNLYLTTLYQIIKCPCVMTRVIHGLSC